MSAASGDRPTLVYLYGPPAVGKLTIAECLSGRMGWPLFHNHLSVNAVRPIFAFGSAPFTGVVHRFRLDVFRTAAAQGLSLVFTNNSAWGGPAGRQRFVAFAGAARAAVEDGGGVAHFVRLTAPRAVLEARLADPSRRRLGKLVNVERLRGLLDELDDAPLHGDDLTVDTSRHTAEQAAVAIESHLAGERRPA